jgi:hypothetical protein
MLLLIPASIAAGSRRRPTGPQVQDDAISSPHRIAGRRQVS